MPNLDLLSVLTVEFISYYYLNITCCIQVVWGSLLGSTVEPLLDTLGQIKVEGVASFQRVVEFYQFIWGVSLIQRCPHFRGLEWKSSTVYKVYSFQGVEIVSLALNL